MLVYLGICAVLAFAAGLAALLLAVPPAPTFHIFLAAGAMPLIFGAVIHFIPVLTRTGPPSRAILALPLVVQLAGVVTPPALAGWLPARSLHVSASVVALAAAVLVVWIARRLRGTLGAPHAGARWYGAALLCLFFAVSLVPVWLGIPEMRPALRFFHIHMNTLGFIGLAALGTLPVLLPTTLGRPESETANRLRSDLPLAVAGAVLIAAGAAGGNWLGFWLGCSGALLLLWGTGRNLLAWLRTYGVRALSGSGATASLAAAALGLLLLIMIGMFHGAGFLPARPSLAGFVVAFLLPLVTGALTQLLPVWRYPGLDSPARQTMRLRLAWGGRLRAALFLLGGILLALDYSDAWALVPLALALFILPLGVALYNSRSI